MARDAYPVGRLETGETKRQRLDKLVAALKQERQSFEPVWQDCAKYILPTRSRWQATDTNNGRRKNQDIVDATATQCVETFQAGMHSGLTSPSRKWFSLAPADPALAEVGAVKDYLSDVREAMLSVMLRSNLYQMLSVHYGDLATFGLGAFAVMEDEQDVIRCYDFPVGTFYIALDDKRRVAVFAHEFRLTVRQIVNQYATPWKRSRDGVAEPDWTNVSDRVHEAWKGGRLDEWVDVVQVVQVNPSADPSRPLERDARAVVSCTFEVAAREGADAEKFLDETAFDEFPVMAGRWSVTGNDSYATSWPGYNAIGDIKEAQLVRKKGAKALDKMVDPPLVADISMRTQVIDMTPGKVTYTTGGPAGKKVEPLYQINPDLAALLEWRAELRAILRRWFREDLFLMLAQTDREMTATEIMERTREISRTLGPLLERLNNDVLGPLIDRVFGIMHRRGLLPEPPQELEGEALRVEYESEMSQALKQSNLVALERFSADVVNYVAQTKDTSVLDKIDVDQWVDELGKAMGLPARVIRSDDDVAAMRAARAQEQQRAQAAERLPAVAGAARDLSETRMGQGSALDALLQEGPAVMGVAA